MLLATAAPAFAQSAPPMPSGGVFTAGSGTIQPGPSTMTITQSSDRGVIDWHDFSIAADHQVSILNGSGATLNRVNGGTLSRIDGMLTATGSVYLMNPHGVVVGPGGQVLTGGSFVASTRAIDGDTFMAGGALTAKGSSDGAIVNAGSIVSRTGSVVMIARAVENNGSIVAGQGHVTLAAADEVLLAATDGKSDGIYVSVAGGRGDVTQTGRIEAASVALRAANGNIFALAGNRDGLIQATGSATIDGQLWLTAPQGKVEVSGTLKAVNADGSGGRIGVNGHDIILAGTANLSAAGTRGGQVLIGTSGYGTGEGLAHSTVIADGARISTGGPGGGGLIETSGHSFDLGPARILPGTGGIWLIDPDDLVIDAAAATGIVTSLNAGGSTVMVQTTAGGTGGVGDITVASPIVWTQPTGNLTIDAYRNIAINAAITGPGDITLNAQGALSVGAAVSGRAVLAQIAGAVTINAGGSLSGTGNVDIVGASFTNLAGAGAVSSSGGTWSIVSDDAANSSDGGLTPDYYLYDYLNATGAPTTGNSRKYREAPSVSFTLGAVTKTYDGTPDIVLGASNVNLTGLVNGDDFTLDGIYASKNAGNGIEVTASNFLANRGGVPVYGYSVTTPMVTAAVGTIDRAVLTAGIIGTPTKTYNATTAVALTSANFQLTGVVSGESIAITGAASAAYDSAGAGSRTVDATLQAPNFSAGSGTLLTNYVLPTTATGAGLINAAKILISGVTANDKIYDGNTTALLNTARATIFGVVPGDTVTLDAAGATGVFATKNVGNAIAVTGTGFVLSGASAGNYVISQPTGLAANITPRDILVTGLVANDKVYDGTRFASVNTDGLVISGIVVGDDVIPVAGTGAQIAFAQKDVGNAIGVTISGIGLGGVDGGNYNLNFASNLTANITPRPLTISGNAMLTKVYDGTTNAVVDSSQVGLGNLVAGESIFITQASGVNYASKNVGIWNVDVALNPSDYQAGPNTLLSNYILPTLGTIQGEITPAPLHITIIGNPTKTYDGNNSASLGPSNYQVDGFITGEGAAVNQPNGTYASSDAGVWTVTSVLNGGNFDPFAGTLMSNYYIPATATGLGTIVRRNLGPGVIYVDITGNPTKIYDGNNIATLVPGDYTLGGFIAGEGAIITQTVGQYGGIDAGPQAVTVQLAPGDFNPSPGTNLNNYTLPTVATGIGTILKAPLSIAITGNPTRVYNGQTRIGLTNDVFTITGVVAGESVTVTPGNIGNFDSDDAGNRTLTVNFPSQANFIAGANTLLTNYTLPTVATGPGTITPAPLNVLNVSALNKVYDQTTAAQLTGTASLFGAISGDDVVLSSVGSTGTFATANVGNGIAVTVAGYTISGADAANYQLFQPSGITANITRRGLTIAGLIANDKLYDGNTTATLGGSPVLVGVLGGDTVMLDGAASTGSFLQSNVGADLRVNIGGFTIAGAQAGNYSLSQPTGLTADINPVTLIGTITGNPTKTYDGTRSVSLGAGNYSLTGFIAGEGGSIAQSAGAAYDSADAGGRTVTATLVVSDFVANAGTLLSNYILPGTISGAGTINQAILTAAIVGNPTKVYDATTVATLGASNYELDGFVAGEGATVNQTVGAYGEKNVGTRGVTATLGSGDFTANSGTLLSNYLLPVSAAGTGTITRAQLHVIGILANDKVYDGATVATLNSAGGGLSGLLGSDVVTLVSGGASGAFATKNVGTNIAVTATGYGITGIDALNYTLLQPTGLAANITEATISLASVIKVYDSTTGLPTANSAYTLSGVVAGDTVFVNAAGITGNYADKNVGTGKGVTVSGVAIGGADAANYTIATTATNQNIGIITPARLDVVGAVAQRKTYDRTTTAQIDNTNTALATVYAGDLVTLNLTSTGNFTNANAGASKPVTATGYSISGADAGNYQLFQPVGLSATIDPKQVFLIAVRRDYTGDVTLPTDASGYLFDGVIAGDTVSANLAGIGGAYADKNVAGSLSGTTVNNGIPVTVTGLMLGGASAGNYFVDPSVASQPIGIIDPKQLIAAIVNNPTKTYDGNDVATLATGNYQITGFVAGEGATINQTLGTYGSVNAGTRSVTATLTAGNFDVAGATALSNYILPTSATGNGTIDPRMLTVSGVIAGNKIYDGNTVATLNNAGATLNNVVPGDTVALNSSTATGQFATKNVGTGIIVTASGYTLDNNSFGNYTLQQPAGLSANITQALLTLTGVTKVYDGTTALPGTAGAYTLSGIVPGDTVTIDTAAAVASGGYGDKNVNTAILVSIGNLQVTGADSGNYSIAPSITNLGIGTITRAPLTAAIIGTPTRTYDGTTAAALLSSNYQLTGFVAGESGTVSQTMGSYNSPDVLTATTVTANINGFIVAGTSTDLNNYDLPTSASGAGMINPAALAIAIIGSPTKIYDGNTAAALAGANYQLTGFFLSEGATVTQTAGSYDGANAGGHTVTTTLVAGDFTANAGTLLSNYVLPTSASGTGQIDQRALTAAVIGTPTKTYDGNMIATLLSSNYQLTGFVIGEGATITRTDGTYAAANAGNQLVTVSLAAGDFAANPGTLLSNYVLPGVATGPGLISRAVLTALVIGNPSRVYDGTDDAILAGANYQLTGFVTGEGATVTQTAGSYDSVNAGSRTVDVLLAAGDFTANAGTDLANYVLPTMATGAGTITQAMLTAAIINTPTKIYDGNAIATLTSTNFGLTGFVSGEGAVVTRTSGAYSSANAGSRNVTTNLLASDFTATGGTLLNNYILPTSASGAGLINQRALTAAVTGVPEKVYDGTNLATLTSANYQLTGFVAGEGATVTQTSGTYASSDAGFRQVTVGLGIGDFVANSGTLLSNYTLPAGASGAGLITRATLTALIIGNPTKVYDGTIGMQITSANYQLLGFVSGQGATVTETTARYNIADAGVRTILASLGSADFVANPGTLLTNYILPVSASGIGTIDRATLTAAIIGNPTKVYDGSTTATLTSANYQLTGFIGSEGATVTRTAGTYGGADAGTWTVMAGLSAGDFTANSGTLLSNYVLPLSASGTGTIIQAQILASIIGTPNKVYDGTDIATLLSSNYQLAGFVAGEGATVTRTAGTYASANAGSRAVNATLTGSDFTANAGTNLANYILPTSAAGPGLISPAVLSAIVIGMPTKTYDGTTLATLNSGNYQLGGFVAGEGATVTQTAGTYASADAGTRFVTATLAAGDFTADAGTLLSNYVLPATATGLGRIDQAILSAIIIGNPGKAYDGTTLATLIPGNYQLSGFIAGEGASVSQTSGSYATAQAGAHLVTANLGSGDFTANAGTNLANYALPTSANGLGTINRAVLTAAIIGNPGKTYDGNAVAVLTSANYALSGFASGEGAVVSQGSGSYASSNAGSWLVTALLGSGDITANAGTDLANYILPTSAMGPGTINRAMLTAAIIGNPTRIYNGTTAAALTAANYQLIGFIAGEGATINQATGNYDTPNAGARTVTVILASQDFAANAGTLLGNYVLPVSASGAGQIDRALLTAAIVNTPTKTYDGTTLATLTAGNFALTGFVAGEGAMVTRNAGIYSSANAGARTVTTSLVASDFAASQGTLLSNYILPAGATGAGLINRADLVVTVTGNPTKPFDGNTSATLGASDFTIGGFVPGEGAIITETHGNYASARPGTHQVSVSLDPGDYSANQGTLLSNYNLPSVAVGPGEITRSGTACAVPYATDCELNGLAQLFGVPRFYIPYPSAYTPYFARTNGLAGLPGVLRQASVTPIPGGLLIRTGMPTINSPEAILMQGEAGKTFTILFPPEQTPAPLDLEETKP
ncbi:MULTISPECIES: YDG domain-containing protein [unclassified Sphingomonas]|uniref:YDG domain-containing protein n=1 Tax=unclassified Sphingomonas TaxID=196159 RepID=UPI001485267B|nr:MULTISPECIES: YDG domain-containing protein [unclassified Sphingomonas]